jgi:NTE family protein
MAQRPIFAIFEGGGAKGVAHIGAVAACEANAFYFVGVAGASAGAIIASLIAAGFTANEILDPTAPETNLLARHKETPISLVGRETWDQAKRYEDRIKAAAQSGRFKSWPARWWLYQNRKPVMTALNRGGFFETEHARKVLNTILREQVKAVRVANGLKAPHPEVVRFRDLDPELCPEFRALKIIAANVDTQELTIFDRKRYPDLEVALAVTASISIPGVFQPVAIPSAEGVAERYMDGGAVANLPVWVFANEKRDYERAFPNQAAVPIVGFTLKPKTIKDDQDSAVPAWVHYFGKGLATALNGSQAVIQDFLDDLTVAPLRTDLGLLKFDASLAEMVVAYNDGRSDAHRHLKHYLTDYPALVRRELADFHETVRRRLSARLPPRARRRRILLRAAIVQEAGREDFRVTYGHNMSRDADDRLSLDVRGRGAALAFVQRDAVFAPVGPTWAHPARDFMTKYERALARREIKAIIALPIFPDADDWLISDPMQRPTPCGVVAIDSDRDIELAAAFDDEHLMSILKAASTLLYSTLRTELPSG